MATITHLVQGAERSGRDEELVVVGRNETAFRNHDIEMTTPGDGVGDCDRDPAPGLGPTGAREVNHG